MANRWFPKGKGHFAAGDIDWDSDTIKLYVVTAGYTPDFTNDEFLDDVGANVVAFSSALTGKSSVNGILNADSPVLAGVSGSTITQVIVAKSTGTDSTSTLLLYWDTGTGLPLTPNGGDITASFDTGANKVAVL